jgi:BirA family biotin operon repressor/biotin-[acetyl-CoA-carboxylase] ligase
VRGRFGTPLEVLESTASTNAVALQWAAAGAPEGALVVADHQTAGRGRWGRAWLSEPGRALLFSLVLRPIEVGLLTTALGVATAQGIESVSGLAASIKWPNDLTIEERKVAGILVETQIENAIVVAAVAGIGVNVDWPASELPRAVADRATSIAAAVESSGAGRVPTRPELLGAILAAIEELSDAPEEVVLERAATRSAVLGRRVVIRLASGETIEGTARRLVSAGALEIDVDGTPEVVTAGEIEQLRPE